jgi:hypothetical protein
MKSKESVSEKGGKGERGGMRKEKRREVMRMERKEIKRD